MRIWRRLRAFGIACSFVAATAFHPLVAAAQADAPDYPIGDGQFFTEALPNRTDGAGFAVEDGQGAQMWRAYQSEGGVSSLGYPISRRFALRGGIAQAFQYGFLLWNSDHGSAERLDFTQLPGRKPPTESIQPDFPPTASAEVDPTPWSGWWWPASDSLGPTLFAPGSPLDKYDQYVQNVTGQNPNTRAWERQELYFPGSSWAGHCNGFAAAALLEPEPTAPVEVLGITFSVADLKGLLVDYHFGDAAAWSFGQDAELNPVDFHRMLLNWIGATNKGFVLTYDMGGGEVWSYPVYRFETSWRMDPSAPDTWQVKTTVWMADMDVPPNFVGTRPYPGPDGKTFTYTVQGDPRNPTDGAWTGSSRAGRFAHPGRIWYPEASVRNKERDLVSPALDRQTMANILAGSDGSGLSASQPSAAGPQP